MVLGGSRDLFAAIAESSATLTGLLFVAMSIAPRRELTAHGVIVQQVRAAAALLAFSTSLAIAFFGLVEGNNVGYAAVVSGVIGLFFTAAGVRSIVGSTRQPRLILRQVGLMVLLLVTFGVELGTGVALIMNGRSTDALEALSNVMVASLLIGMARAWELVGERGASLLSSIAVLTGHPRSSPIGPAASVGESEVTAPDDDVPRTDDPPAR